MTKVSGTISRLNVKGAIARLNVCGVISRLGICGSISEGGAAAAPVFVNATVESLVPNEVYINYDKNINLFSVPDKADYSITLSGGAVTITTVFIVDLGGYGTYITLTLSRSVVAGETGTITYTQGTIPVIPVAGGSSAASFSESITNNSTFL